MTATSMTITKIRERFLLRLLFLRFGAINRDKDKGPAPENGIVTTFD
jgi:hypothetical protein